MANFSESRIQTMLNELKDEFGPDIATRELAILELEDMERKGCTHESANKFDQCRDCPNSEKCPVLDWEKRHPEYANDELAMKIKVLEAGGEEAYKAKLEAQAEAKRKAEEEANRATDTDKVEAARYLLNVYFKSKTTHTESAVLYAVNEVLYAETKTEIQEKMKEFAEEK
jgi:hypothetical protein